MPIVFDNVTMDNVTFDNINVDLDTTFRFTVDTNYESNLAVTLNNYGDTPIIPNAIINWGDGNTTLVTEQGEYSYTYASTGTYEVVIEGTTPYIILASQPNIISLNAWGNNVIKTGIGANENFAIVPTVLGKTCQQVVFNGLPIFNDANIVLWDTSNLTNMSDMFSECAAFNQPLGNWDVGNVVTMDGMFYNANSFNQDLTAWNVSNIEEDPPDFINYDTEPYTFQPNYWPVWGAWPDWANAAIFNNDNDIDNFVDFVFPDASIDIILDRGYFDKQIRYEKETDFIGGFVGGGLNTGNYTIRLAYNKANTIIPSSIQLFADGLTRIDSFGNLQISQWKNGFHGNIINVPTSIPNYINEFSWCREALNFNDANIVLWDTSNITNMGDMFFNCAVFNQDIGGWNTANVANMDSMLNGATVFDQDLTDWCVTNIATEPTSFATGSALDANNYPIWGTCP